MGPSAMADDEVAYWKQERTKLQEQLRECESGAVQQATLPFIRYLKTRISDLDRYIASLESKRSGNA